MEDKNVISFSLDRAGKQVVSKGNTGITGSHRTSKLNINASAEPQLDSNCSEFSDLSFNGSNLLYDNIDKLGDTLKSFDTRYEKPPAEEEPILVREKKFIYNDDSLTEEDLIKDLDSHLNFEVTKNANVKPNKYEVKQTIIDNFCGSCGRKHEPGDVFCRTCGRRYEPVEILCLNCGRKYKYGDVFCGTCGHKYEI